MMMWDGRVPCRMLLIFHGRSEICDAQFLLLTWGFVGLWEVCNDRHGGAGSSLPHPSAPGLSAGDRMHGYAARHLR